MTRSPPWRASRTSFVSVPTPVYTREWFATATFAAEAVATPDASVAATAAPKDRVERVIRSIAGPPHLPRARPGRAPRGVRYDRCLLAMLLLRRPGFNRPAGGATR